MTGTSSPQNSNAGLSSIAGLSNVTVRSHNDDSGITVLRAFDQELDRLVAVRIRRGPVTKRSTGSIHRAARAAERIGAHQMFDTLLRDGSTGAGEPYAIYEWSPASFDQTDAADGPTTVDDKVALVAETAMAIDLAHRRGVAHGALSPDAIVAGRDGSSTIIELDHAHFLDGSTWHAARRSDLLPFTAPELLAGDPPSERSDIYALGATMYALLAGHAPFDPESTLGTSSGILAIASRVRTDAPKPIPGVKPRLMEIIDSAMAKNPEARPATAALFATQLAALPRHMPARTTSAEPIDDPFENPLIDEDTQPIEPVGQPARPAAATPARPAPRQQTGHNPQRPMAPVAGAHRPTAPRTQTPHQQTPHQHSPQQRRRVSMPWIVGALSLVALVVVAAVAWNAITGLTDSTNDQTRQVAVERDDAPADPTEVPLAIDNSDPELTASEFTESDAADADPAASDPSDVDSDPAAQTTEDADSSTSQNPPLAATDNNSASGDSSDNNNNSDSNNSQAESVPTPTYRNRQFEARLPDGWNATSELRDVGYGFRTEFDGPDRDFLLVDFTPPSRHDGTETIEESAYRIAAQVPSAGPVMFERIGDKDTWWFEFIGNDGSQRIDLFFAIGDTGYAVVGGAHGDVHSAYDAARSFVASFQQT